MKNITLFFTSFSITLLIVLVMGYNLSVRPLAYLKKTSINTEQTVENSDPLLEIPKTSVDLSISTDSIELNLNEFGLELPVNGATGFTSIEVSLYKDCSKQDLLMKLAPGTAFRILEQNRDMWYVQVEDTKGFLEHKYCMINLPDVIPSIIYYNSNSNSSLFKSVGRSLDGITGNQLYNATAFNDRFGEQQYIMPVLYSMSKRIAHTQKDALKDGNCLKIYETYRPHDVQEAVSNALSALMNRDPEVMSMVESKPWEKDWFISTSISNHQKGAAMDVSLVKVSSARRNYCGNYSYIKVLDYEEYKMPTNMHELSTLACTFTSTVPSNSKTAWRNATLSASMNQPAVLLQHYCTNNELYPLASEWWHFNDLNSLEALGKNYGKGMFSVTSIVSSIPE